MQAEQIDTILWCVLLGGAILTVGLFTRLLAPPLGPSHYDRASRYVDEPFVANHWPFDKCKRVRTPAAAAAKT